MMAVRGKRKQRWRQRTNMFRCPLPSPLLQPCTPHLAIKESFLLRKEEKHCCCPHFLCQAFLSRHISVSLWFVFGGESPCQPLSVFLVFQKEAFAFILFCITTQPLFLLDFL